MAAIGELHSAELVPLHIGQAVQLGQSFIDEGVLGIDQVDQAAVLFEDRAEEELGLSGHVGPQLVIEVGELVGVGRDLFGEELA